MKYNTYTLKNGLRVIHLASASPVVYCGYEVNAGARNEEEGDEGLAHFVEHVTFKGTKRRKALQIINCLESVGGELNAFTTKEDTVYYSAILKDHVRKAIDLLTDIVFHSIYPQHEIDKEVEVICDEIESYNDSPAELIYDEFENIVFRGHPLGHNILGQADRVRKFTTEDALRFAEKFYTPENAIFFLYGDVDFKKLITMLEKQDFGLRANKNIPEQKKAISSTKGGQHIIDKNTHQAHVMMGNLGYDIMDQKRMALYVMNNILGGPGMNARLNLALRERNGLVYTVESSMVSYGDAGIWCTYFGCDPHDVKRCIRLVRKELNKFMTSPLTDRQLEAAKKQLKGQIGVACDNRENFALDFGKSFLHYGWEKDITSLYRHIDAVTASDIQTVANEIFAEDKMTTLIYE